MRLIILALLAASLDAQIMPQVLRVVGQAHTDFTRDASCVGAWLMNGPGKEQDVSGHGNTLAPITTTPYLQPAFASGFAGMSRLFSGVPGNALSVVDGTSLDISGATAKVSIVARIKPKTNNYTGAFIPVVSKYATSGNQRQYWFSLVGEAGGTYSIHGYVSGNGVAREEVASTAINYAVNVEHAIALVANNTDLRIYVDGALASSAVAHTTGVYNGSTSFQIGSVTTTSSYYFDGGIDDVAVFNRALTSTEVASIASYGVNGRLGRGEGDAIYTVFRDSPGTLLSYAAFTAALDTLCSAHPGWTCTSFGNSVQNRPIRHIVIPSSGTAAYTFLVDGGIHGYEPEGARAALDVLYYLATNPQWASNIRWVVNPIYSPDGYVTGTRKNAHGVDLNRNHTTGWGNTFVETGCPGSTDPANDNYIGPSAGSEPETTAAVALITAYTPKYHVTFHGDMNSIFGLTSEGTALSTAVNTQLRLDGQLPYTYEGIAQACGHWRDYAVAQGVQSWEIELSDPRVSDRAGREYNRIISAIRAIVAAQP
jgi:hypothetical protein